MLNIFHSYTILALVHLHFLTRDIRPAVIWQFLGLNELLSHIIILILLLFNMASYDSKLCQMLPFNILFV